MDAVILTQTIPCQQKMPMQKLYDQFHVSKNGVHVDNFEKLVFFPNIQLQGVVNRLAPFKILSDHTSRSLMG